MAKKTTKPAKSTKGRMSPAKMTDKQASKQPSGKSENAIKVESSGRKVHRDDVVVLDVRDTIRGLQKRFEQAYNRNGSYQTSLPRVSFEISGFEAISIYIDKKVVWSSQLYSRRQLNVEFCMEKYIDYCRKRVQFLETCENVKA